MVILLYPKKEIIILLYPSPPPKKVKCYPIQPSKKVKWLSKKEEVNDHPTIPQERRVNSRTMPMFSVDSSTIARMDTVRRTSTCDLDPHCRTNSTKQKI